MWPFLEYFDRKIDAHHIGSSFWTIDNILAPQAIFVFWCFWTCGFEKHVTNLREKVPQHSVRQNGLSVQTQKQTAYSAFWTLTDVGHQYDYQWGPLLTKYLKHDARASPCCQKRWRGGLCCQMFHNHAVGVNGISPDTGCMYMWGHAQDLRIAATDSTHTASPHDPCQCIHLYQPGTGSPARGCDHTINQTYSRTSAARTRYIPLTLPTRFT